ncbi:hypothetical protein COU59_00420 [Candidatus Pacearchaeota archaeon CG10_big_fil_rev_8_21_14_0_10_34_12]|nr:MAG: hypothetical protein COU59_00420 [Candidatus Pacearchaeota archaeon CG10_big_fil_rev_8_21_14_0_10_34_12]
MRIEENETCLSYEGMSVPQELIDISNNPEHFRILYLDFEYQRKSPEEIAESYGLNVDKVKCDLDLLRRVSEFEVFNIESILGLSLK